MVDICRDYDRIEVERGEAKSLLYRSWCGEYICNNFELLFQVRGSQNRGHFYRRVSGDIDSVKIM
jgi:hypothetical protein